MGAIKNSRGALTLQNGPGAPAGNRNAQRHGMYSRRPTVNVPVPVDATLDDMEAFVGSMAGGALWIAQEMDWLADDVVDVYEREQMVALYAAVAGEAYDLRATLEGRAGLRSSPLGRLRADQYDALLRGSAASLELLLSQVASAKQRLEVDGLLVAGKRDNERAMNPTLRYLASTLRKAMRQAWRHAEYIAWGQDDQDGAILDPAAVLQTMHDYEEDGHDE